MSIKIVEKLRKIIDQDTTLYRDKLNKNVHVVDISYIALKYSDPSLTLEDYNHILDGLKEKFKSTTSLKRSMEVVKDPSALATYAAIVEDDVYGIYLVAKSYKAIQTRVAAVMKELDNGSKFTGRDEDGKTVVNIGHIPSSQVAAAKSPLSSKLAAVLATVSVSAVPAVNKIVEELYTTHTEAEYSFQRPDFDLKGFNKILGTSTVLVTIHTAEKNNELAKLEKAISDKVSKYVTSDEFVNELLETKGSNSIKEDIANAVIVAMGGKGNNQNKHSKKAPVKIESKKSANPKLTASKLVLKNVQTGRNIGLPRLLAYINVHLHNVVAANMGNGDRTDILNYRTGRFATSTRAERVSMSRNGMITVYYDYMKNPYATFSTGGKQEYPRTRDPKLLISKSIREIARELVDNDLRTVLA